MNFPRDCSPRNRFFACLLCQAPEARPIGSQSIRHNLLSWAVPFCVFFRNFNATFLSRRFVTKPSKTSRSWWTALHRWCWSPLIFTKTSSKCHRQRLDRSAETRRFEISAANIGPNRFHQSRTVLRLISMQRSCRTSPTLRSEHGKRTYIITARRITSGLVLKDRKGLRFSVP